MVGADVDGDRGEVVQLSEQLAAVLHGCEVGFVIAEPGTDGLVGTLRVGEIDVDRDRSGVWLGRGLRSGQKKEGKQKNNRTSNHGISDLIVGWKGQATLARRNNLTARIVG